jgi:hypothetical protein
MSEFKGSKGPWVFDGAATVFDDRNRDPICCVDYCCPEEDRANGRLIAAAPTMLSDLKEAAALLREYEKLHRAKNTEESTIKAERNKAWAEQFEATIAKATQ